ncbi:MAG: AI-2E family transporter [Proteobacteria bacterium]|nr:AI-2E family transporter [Candidatus Enterousia scatequi]
MNKIIIAISSIFILWIGRPILIPFFVAVFFWYLINAIATYYRHALPYQNKNDCKHCTQYCFYNFISLFLSLITMGLLILLIATQIKPMFSEFMGILPELQRKLSLFGEFLSESFGFKFDINMIPNIPQIAKSVGSSVASLAASVGMILIYMLFLFIEQGTFENKLSHLFTDNAKSKKIRFILSSIDNNMKKYLFMKTIISLATGICGYIWLRAIGLEFAGVWAFLLFLLNYIPTIGSVVACGLPILFALISGNGLDMAILTALGLIGLQILWGNILDPKLTGKALNISTLAILVNLVFWGLIWGIAGMFFSVPILVALYVAAAQFDSTRWIAVLLSADGTIPEKTKIK